MTFDQWWYDYRIKEGIGSSAAVKTEIARAAWNAATNQAALMLDGRAYTLECCDTRNDWAEAQKLKPIAAQIRSLKTTP